MKKSKLLALLLSAALMAQPVAYASAEVRNVSDVNETVAAEQTESQKVTDTAEMNSEDDESMAAIESESESEVQTDVSDVMNSDGEADHQIDATTIETNQTSDKDVVETSDAEGQMPEGMAVGGYIHSDLDYNTPVYYGDSDDGISVMSFEVPAAYPCDDPNDSIQQVRDKYPEVRNQGKYGTCWAFSALGVAEFDLISQEFLTKVADLSELQLVYYTYNFVQDPLGGTEGDTATYYNENASTSYLDRGGNFEMAVRRLAQWVSPTDETVVPYTDAGKVLSEGLANEYAYNKDAVHLENAYMINIKENAKGVKEAIMERGAVGIMYQHTSRGAYYGTNYNTYYDTDKSGGGHAVMIVGWNDNFSKENFGGNSQPSKDGAWLVRNSWGEGDFDYFWMSYDTASLAETAWSFDYSTADNYDNNYQLDGGINTYYDANHQTVANVFTVSSKKDGVKAEELKAVSLSFTHAANVGYTIEIYSDVDSDAPMKFWSDQLQEDATTTGRTTYAGVYTIQLNKAVELKPGTKFAIVVTMDKPAMDYEQAQSEVSGEKMVWECTVSQSNPKSRYKQGTSFYSNYNNYCIKAFTTNEPYSINYELNGGTNNSENPTTCGSEEIALKDPTREGCTFDGWYTDSKYEGELVTTIPANASQDYTLYAKWSSITGEILKGYTVSMKGKSDLNFYMTLPDNVKNNNDAYVEFTIPDGDTQKVMVKDAEKSENGYIFTCGVSARQMASLVEARMVVNGTKGAIYTHSVKKYAESLLKNSTDETVINVVKAMLNYGAAAQVEFKYNTDTLANENLSEDDKVISRADFSGYKYSIENTENISGISYYGGTLSLRSGTCVKDYFIMEDGQSVDDYTFHVVSGSEEEKLQPKKATINNKECYYVEVDNIRAYDLDKIVTVVVRKQDQQNSVGMKVNYGPFSYAQAVSGSSSSDETLMNVINALYVYWKNAKSYVDANTNQN